MYYVTVSFHNRKGKEIASVRVNSSNEVGEYKYYHLSTLFMNVFLI